jgi:hypothetical protein
VLSKKHRYVGPIIAGVLSLLIFVFAGWLVFNQQYAVDQVTVWSFRPSSEVKAIEDRAEFTGKGEFYFYASQPEVASGDRFNQGCPRYEVGSPILGCYTTGKIYIFDVTNEKLDGIEEVTAAHEMLHAVWERMSDSEKQKIGALLRAAYYQRAGEELIARMEYYERTEPGQFENELHSILGTEVSSLGDELEDYYSGYFEDRQAVLALHDGYNSVFESLSNRSEELYEDLVALEQAITVKTVRYNADVALLSDDIDDFNSRADSGAFASTTQFNQERAALMARSSQLEADRAAINADIAQYNSKYKEYQKVASQIEALNDSLDSIDSLKPQPTL